MTYRSKCRHCKNEMEEDNIFCSSECKSSWFMDYKQVGLAA